MLHNYLRRDEILRLIENWEENKYGIAHVGPITMTQLVLLRLEGFATIKSNPDLHGLVYIMRKYDDIFAYGYARSPYREDTDVIIDKLRFLGQSGQYIYKNALGLIWREERDSDLDKLITKAKDITIIKPGIVELWWF